MVCLLSKTLNLYLVMEIRQSEIVFQLFFSVPPGLNNIELTNHVGCGLTGITLVPSHLRKHNSTLYTIHKYCTVL